MNTKRAYAKTWVFIISDHLGKLMSLGFLILKAFIGNMNQSFLELTTLSILILNITFQTLKLKYLKIVLTMSRSKVTWIVTLGSKLKTLGKTTVEHPVG